MPPIGIHFLVNFAIAGAVTYVLRSKASKTVLAAISYGLIFGSVIPDTDLILSSLSFLVTFDTGAGKLIHRTFTHSIFGIVPIILVGLVGFLILVKKKENDDKDIFSFKNRKYLYTFILALGVGMAIHTVLDLFYLVGVKTFFPISTSEFLLGPLRKENLSTPLNNLINGIDFITDTIYYMLIFYLATGYRTNMKKKRYLTYFTVINLIIFIPLTLIFFSSVTYDGFLIISYIPGVIFIFVSTLWVPLYFKDTFDRFGNRLAKDKSE
ncbi:MAG: metal-dependent hydrolase [Candidatus Thermoplasmatota archaeon]|jgi:membrane-bound metal-dependent hydrolase YbcI (DUF457 family)|nr:metal-dependent hydrolase [Candidatus Thermoplasmatota archaeon]MDP7265163.1 metal-dependent hydrolase [Candidatus Thermoplasmatota archaeon]